MARSTEVQVWGDVHPENMEKWTIPVRPIYPPLPEGVVVECLYCQGEMTPLGFAGDLRKFRCPYCGSCFWVKIGA